ncbi:unnamed protein product [Peronospora belbahrii]|uniref:Uncharacterized protein n=1 Tax=Peronospora belbahrii TaxID=622444 RepID=A0ABN8CVI7_9STRA|nr:unnamed protein product [Peronospora belbahrii]
MHSQSYLRDKAHYREKLRACCAEIRLRVCSFNVEALYAVFPYDTLEEGKDNVFLRFSDGADLKTQLLQWRRSWR